MMMLFWWLSGLSLSQNTISKTLHSLRWIWPVVVWCSAGFIKVSFWLVSEWVSVGCVSLYFHTSIFPSIYTVYRYLPMRWDALWRENSSVEAQLSFACHLHDFLSHSQFIYLSLSHTIHTYIQRDNEVKHMWYCMQFSHNSQKSTE